MPRGNILPRFRDLAQILTDLFVERNLPFFDQHHYGSRGKLLSYGARLEDRLWFDGDLMFEIRKPVSFHDQRLSILYDGQGNTWNFLPGHLGCNKLIDLFRSVLRHRSEAECHD